jgi:hypothetical protein
MCSHQQMKLQHDLMLIIPLSSLPSSWIHRSVTVRERSEVKTSYIHIYHHQIMLAASPTCGAPLTSLMEEEELQEQARLLIYPREGRGRDRERREAGEE